MPNNQYWLGTAQAVAQVRRFTPGGTIGTETFTLTCNGKTVTYTAESGDTAADVVDGIIAAFGDSTAPEFIAEVSMTDGGTYVDVTMNTPGVPATITSGATGSATFVASTPAAASGPNFWNVAANWSAAAVPAANDTITVEGEVPILYGLDAATITLDQFIIQNRTAAIGLPPRNANGYAEYRDQELKIGATILRVEASNSAGLIRINLGTVQTTATVNGTGTAVDSLVPAMTLKGTHASNIVNVMAGDVGFAIRPAETTTIATLNIGDGVSSSPTVTIGSGVTLTTLKMTGGTVASYAAATTVTVEGGTLIRRGAAAITTANIRYQGSYRDEASGTVTTMNVGTGGRVEFNNAARTVTTCKVYAGGTLTDNHKNVTFTNGVALQQCRLRDCTVEVGPNVTISVA